MFRRALMMSVLSALLFVTVAAAQPAADLLWHQRVFQGREVQQAAAMLQLPAPPPNGWATPAALREAQVDAALDWFAAHGYLFDDPAISIDLVSDGNGNSLVIDGPGIHVVIILPCGPFLPTQREQLMVATVIRNIPPIYNGF